MPVTWSSNNFSQPGLGAWSVYIGLCRDESAKGSRGVSGGQYNLRCKRKAENKVAVYHEASLATHTLSSDYELFLRNRGVSHNDGQCLSAVLYWHDLRDDSVLIPVAVLTAAYRTAAIFP